MTNDMQVLHVDYDKGEINYKSLAYLVSISSCPKGALTSFIERPNFTEDLERTVFITASNLTFGFLKVVGILIGDSEVTYYPLADGMDSMLPIFTEAASLAPSFFQLVNQGLPIVKVSVDEASVASYAERARTNKKYLTGSRAHQVSSTFSVLSTTDDPRWSTLDAAKRVKYPNFMGVKAILEHQLIDNPNDRIFILTGYVNDQWPDLTGNTVFTLVGTFNDTTMYGLFVDCSTYPAVNKRYSPYSIAHYRGMEIARLQGCTYMDYGHYLPYKEVLGFPIYWLPSLRLTDSAQAVVDQYIR